MPGRGAVAVEAEGDTAVAVPVATAVAVAVADDIEAEVLAGSGVAEPGDTAVEAVGLGASAVAAADDTGVEARAGFAVRAELQDAAAPGFAAELLAVTARPDGTEACSGATGDFVERACCAPPESQELQRDDLALLVRCGAEPLWGEVQQWWLAGRGSH